ncbi:GTPase Era [Nitrosomonas sp.]|uniref:GTPase Era n=1 Tax=Nitrosomonas sp. TaxID=42353 RepID=UPI001E1942AC|nr:GTPase Era [Nitrosomonas sp.]MCB1949213.1 GTPase Era [Nitrosomonas sp.]MCP5242216.1 GTPase Era [Burkholderiales bacterium]MDR4514202.1 GTPase Era [Nitrosomonas sp.]
MQSDIQFRTGYAAIVGRPNVGKSTLLNSLIRQKISITSRKAQTTRYRINGILTDQHSQIIFVDTPGFQTRYKNRMNTVMNKVVAQSVQDVDVVLFVIEALRFDEQDRLVLELLPETAPVILVVNKIDQLTDKNRLLPFLDEMSRQYGFSAMIPVSAAGQIQLTNLVNAIRPYLPANPPFFEADEITDRNVRFIAAELIREKLFRLIGDEIPYSTSVIVDQFVETEKLNTIYATILIDKPGQKAIIIGRSGEKLKLISSQARKEMEILFNKKVYLQVWVKVRSGWANDVHVLKQLGHE